MCFDVAKLCSDNIPHKGCLGRQMQRILVLRPAVQHDPGRKTSLALSLHGSCGGVPRRTQGNEVARPVQDWQQAHVLQDGRDGAWIGLHLAQEGGAQGPKLHYVLRKGHTDSKLVIGVGLLAGSTLTLKDESQEGGWDCS